MVVVEDLLDGRPPDLPRMGRKGVYIVLGLAVQMHVPKGAKARSILWHVDQC